MTRYIAPRRFSIFWKNRHASAAPRYHSGARSGYAHRIEARRQDYYELLQRCRTHGDWIGWIRFFLHGVTESATEAVLQASRLMDLREKWRKELRNKARDFALLDELFINPYMTVLRAEKTLKVSNPTARQAVTYLQKMGLLEEVSGRSWGRLYLARPIMRAIEMPPKPKVK